MKKRLQYKDMQKIWNDYYLKDKIKKNDGYVIHHKDKNPLNNDINNLQKMTKKEHTSLHHKNRIVTEEQRKKISKSKKGKCSGKNNPF